MMLLKMEHASFFFQAADVVGHNALCIWQCTWWLLMRVEQQQWTPCGSTYTCSCFANYAEHLLAMFARLHCDCCGDLHLCKRRYRVIQCLMTRKQDMCSRPYMTCVLPRLANSVWRPIQSQYCAGTVRAVQPL
jgi:hypothetical protein